MSITGSSINSSRNIRNTAFKKLSKVDLGGKKRNLEFLLFCHIGNVKEQEEHKKRKTCFFTSFGTFTFKTFSSLKMEWKKTLDLIFL